MLENNSSSNRQTVVTREAVDRDQVECSWPRAVAGSVKSLTTLEGIMPSLKIIECSSQMDLAINSSNTHTTACLHHSLWALGIRTIKISMEAILKTNIRWTITRCIKIWPRETELGHKKTTTTHRCINKIKEDQVLDPIQFSMKTWLHHLGHIITKVPRHLVVVFKGIYRISAPHLSNTLNRPVLHSSSLDRLETRAAITIALMWIAALVLIRGRSLR